MRCRWRGKESAWAYTHLPHQMRGDAGDEMLTGSWDAREQEIMADRDETQVECYAPGFRGLIRARRILVPPTLESLDVNIHGPPAAVYSGSRLRTAQRPFRNGWANTCGAWLQLNPSRFSRRSAGTVEAAARA